MKLEDIYKYERSILIHGKGKKERFIYISSNDTWRNLNRYLKLRKKYKFKVENIFVNRYGDALSIYSIEDIYDKYIKSDESKPLIQVIDNSSNTTTINHIGTLTEKQYLEPTHINFSVTVESIDGTSKTIEYEGPATEIETVLKALKEYEE